MSNEFIYCPQCGSSNVDPTDYEVEGDAGEYEVDEDGRQCIDCNWEGDVSELVCADDDEVTV